MAKLSCVKREREREIRSISSLVFTMPCHCHKSCGLEIVILRRCWSVQSYVEEMERERERERTFFGSFASCMRKKQAHKVSDMDAGHLVAADFFLIFFL